jgi:hypothetical protein
VQTAFTTAVPATFHGGALTSKGGSASDVGVLTSKGGSVTVSSVDGGDLTSKGGSASDNALTEITAGKSESSWFSGFGRRSWATTAVKTAMSLFGRTFTATSTCSIGSGISPSFEDAAAIARVADEVGDEVELWTVDSAADFHIRPEPSKMVESKQYHHHKAYFPAKFAVADDTAHTVLEIRTEFASVDTLNGAVDIDTTYCIVPNIRHKLLAVAQLEEQGVSFHSGSDAHLRMPDGKCVPLLRVGRAYVLKVQRRRSQPVLKTAIDLNLDRATLTQPTSRLEGFSTIQSCTNLALETCN